MSAEDLLRSSRDLEKVARVLRCRPEEVAGRVAKLQGQVDHPKRGPKAQWLLAAAAEALPPYTTIEIDEPDGHGFAIVARSPR